MTPEEKKAKFQTMSFDDQRDMVVDVLVRQVGQFLTWGVSLSVVMAAFRAFAVNTWINEPDAVSTFRILADELEQKQREQGKRSN